MSQPAGLSLAESTRQEVADTKAEIKEVRNRTKIKEAQIRDEPDAATRLALQQQLAGLEQQLAGLQQQLAGLLVSGERVG